MGLEVVVVTVVVVVVVVVVEVVVAVVVVVVVVVNGIVFVFVIFSESEALIDGGFEIVMDSTSVSDRLFNFEIETELLATIELL